MLAKQLSLLEQIATTKDLACEPDDYRIERPETYKGMYAMHKYWSKKPHNLVARYIEKFSGRGELVLDAFCGSGVTVMESVRLGRRAAGFEIMDISPLEYSARSVVQDSRRNALKTDFVITCQKQMPRTSRKLVFGHSQTQIESLIHDYLIKRENGAETFEILDHLLINGVPQGTMFKVSNILQALERVCFTHAGRWRLKSSSIAIDDAFASRNLILYAPQTPRAARF